MQTSDILFGYQYPFSLKRAILELMENNSVYQDLEVLIPSESNDDVNGSQHARNGGNDFTYDSATEENVLAAETLGHYEYFSSTGYGYTGHYYHGSDSKFAAIVIDPPAYAVEITL